MASAEIVADSESWRQDSPSLTDDVGDSSWASDDPSSSSASSSSSGGEDDDDSSSGSGGGGGGSGKSQRGHLDISWSEFSRWPEDVLEEAAQTNGPLLTLKIHHNIMKQIPRVGCCRCRFGGLLFGSFGGFFSP